MNAFNKTKITLLAGVVGLLVTSLQAQANPPPRPKTAAPWTCPAPVDVKNDLMGMVLKNDKYNSDNKITNKNELKKITSGTEIEIKGKKYFTIRVDPTVNYFSSGIPNTPKLEVSDKTDGENYQNCRYTGMVVKGGVNPQSGLRGKENAEQYNVILILPENAEEYKMAREEYRKAMQK